VSNCCLTPNEFFFQLYHSENKLHFMRWWWCLLCTRPIQWVWSL